MIARPTRPPRAVTVLGIACVSSLLLFVACSVDVPAEPASVTGLEAADGTGAGSLAPMEAAFAPDPSADRPSAAAERMIDPADFPPGTVIEERAGRPPVITLPTDTPQQAMVDRPSGQLIGRPTGNDMDTVPTFTPYEVRPTLINRAEFGQELERRYPPMLKDAGIGGQVVMWVLVDRTGEVGHTRLVTSSGDSRLDQVALEVMRTARFQPALHDDERVAVWIQLPVTFQPRTAPAPATQPQ